MGAIFALRPRARPLEPYKVVVLFNHWFMPYKVERGRQSFQCGTTKIPKALTGLAFGLEAKNVPTIIFFENQSNHWIAYFLCA